MDMLSKMKWACLLENIKKRQDILLPDEVSWWKELRTQKKTITPAQLLIQKDVYSFYSAALRTIFQTEHTTMWPSAYANCDCPSENVDKLPP